MKPSKHQQTTLLATSLALALTAAAAASPKYLQSRRVPSSHVGAKQFRRSLEDGGGFDLGQWAGDLWEDVQDAFDFGGDGQDSELWDQVGDLFDFGSDNNNDNNNGILDQVGDLFDFGSDNNNESEDPGGEDTSGSIAGIDWGNAGAWDDWLSLLFPGGDDPEGRLDVCSLVEAAIGMGSGFGIEANCQCNGDLATGFAIKCNFDECAPGTDACGTVDLGLEFGGPDGTVNTTVCADFQNDAYQETCFSYELDMRDGNTGTVSQECSATYGGQPCSCSIDNGICLTVDCSPLLPGAKMDTCQALSMVDMGDLENWIPSFDVFQPGFALGADSVPWNDLEFDQLDFANFDVANLQWDNFDFDLDASTWMDLLGDNPTAFLDGTDLAPGVCTMMSQAVKMTEELGGEGSCECGADEATGVLTLKCAFSEACTESDGSGSDGLFDLPQLCGSVTMDLTFASLASINADVCVQYADFPETCYSYGIPFAESGGSGSTSPPLPPPPPQIGPINGPDNGPAGDLSSPLLRECSARYGPVANDCTCTLDENSCLRIDCTDVEPLAVTERCQVIDLEGAVEASRMIPQFQVPSETDVVSDGEGGTFVASAAQASDNSNSRSGAGPRGAVGALAVVVAALSTVGLFYGGQPW